MPYEPWLPHGILEFDHDNWDYRDASVGRYFDAAVFPLVLQEMTLREKNLQLMLHTHMVDAVVEHRQNCSGDHSQQIRPPGDPATVRC